MKHIFIIGSRGLPAKYGGFETFVEELIRHRQSKDLVYHVACFSEESHHKHFDYQGADCFTIKVPKLGAARVIAYDMLALSYSLELVRQQQIVQPVFLILGNTIGAFIRFFSYKIHQVGGRFFVNPDGLEWRRSKWSRPVQSYLKYSEKAMAKAADLVVCDNVGIETYIHQHYPWAPTAFIAYGTDTAPSVLTRESLLVRDFFKKWNTKEGEYYLVLGRFVPENNYETIIKEVMASTTKRHLLIICNHEGNPYFEVLKKQTRFDRDSRICFVGSLYHRDLVTYLRGAAFAYIHGHEVGGTNPSLLEGLAHTNLNLVYDVSFNHHVAQETALYWNKEKGSLAHLIEQVERKEPGQVLGEKAKQLVRDQYTWEKIVAKYEEIFLQ